MSPAFAYSQNNPERAKGAFSAQFLISTDLKSVNLHMIGGNFKYSIGNNGYSVALMPTLSFKEDHPEDGKRKKPFVRPGFSIGPLYQYKRYMVGIPIFYQDDKWHLNIGIGMRVGS